MQPAGLTIANVGVWSGLVKWVILATMLTITFILINKDKDKKSARRSYLALLITVISAPFLILEINTPLKVADTEENINRSEETPETKKPEVDNDYIPTVNPNNEGNNNGNQSSNQDTSDTANYSSQNSYSRTRVRPAEAPQNTSDNSIPSSSSEDGRGDDDSSEEGGDEPAVVNVDYTVLHQKMNVSGSGYTTADTDTGTGKTGDEITPDVKSYDGFTAPSTQTTTLGNEPVTITYLYKRNEYSLAIASSENVETSTPSGDYYYDTPITLKAKTLAGHTFSHWSSDDININGSTTNTITFNISSKPISVEPHYTTNQYTIVFDKNSADATGEMQSQTVSYGEQFQLNQNQFALEQYKFIGWNRNSSATTAEFADEASISESLAEEGTVTLYAIWEEKFPIVWQHTGECTFGGENGTISNCGEYNGQRHIDTGIKLYDETYISKDYEITFEIVDYDPSAQDAKDNQATFISAKAPSNYESYGTTNPGLVIRQASQRISINTKNSNASASNTTLPLPVTKIRVVRKDDTIYYAFNDDKLLYQVQNINQNDVIDIPTWIGGYPSNPQLSESKRILKGTLKNITIRRGEMDDFATYNVSLDLNGGKLDGDNRKTKAIIKQGDTITELPEIIRSDYLFDEWKNKNTNESFVSGIQPTGDITFKAYWTKDISQATVSNPVINLTAGSTEAIIVGNASQVEAFTYASSDEGIATVDENGTVTAVAPGETTIILTGSRSSLTQSVTVTVTAPTPTTYTVHFDANGGEAVNDMEVGINQAIGTLPTTERTDYVFDGWFTEKKDGSQITPITVIDSEKTYYAHWHYDTMPIVWQNEGQCIFAASSKDKDNNGSVSGDGCDPDYIVTGNNGQYIDTGVALFSQANYKKDFEISFQIDAYVPSDNYSQATFVNAKSVTLANNPGLIIRRYNNLIEFNSKDGHDGNMTGSRPNLTGSYPHTAVVKREGGVIKYSLDGSEFAEAGPGYSESLFEQNNKYFDLTTWFGAYPTTTGTNKHLTATLSHMHIKLERDAPQEPSDEIVEHNITSQAVRDYYASVASWDTGEQNKNNYHAALKANYERNNCQNESDDNIILDVSTDFGYKYTSGSVICDGSVPYDTGANADLKVYDYDEATETKGDEVPYIKIVSGKIYNMEPGKTYKWEKADDESTFGYVKAVTENGTRMLSIGSLRNSRDIGGLKTANNKTIKYGRLIRGEKLGSDSTAKTDLINLGVTKEYDLRKPSELDGTVKLDNWVNKNTIHYAINPSVTDEQDGYALTHDTVSSIMTDIIAGENIYFHCRVGSDRTGTVAYILEGLLGVSDEDRTREYELTTFSGRSDRTRYYDHKNNYDGTNGKKFMYMKTYLGTNQDIYNWFTNNGTDADAINLVNAFRTEILE